jgi:hypothetical protein
VAYQYALDVAGMNGTSMHEVVQCRRKYAFRKPGVDRRTTLKFTSELYLVVTNGTELNQTARLATGLCYELKWNNKHKQTPWPFVRKRTIPTERSPIVDEIYSLLLWIQRCRVISAVDPPRSLFQFSIPEALLFFEVAPHLGS